MRDYIDIGPVPSDEECTPVGEDREKEMRECRAYIEAIRKKLGNEPKGASLKIKSNPHEFGSYLEVVCYYEEENETATEYAFKCEGEAPTTWAEVGMVAPT